MVMALLYGLLLRLRIDARHGSRPAEMVGQDFSGPPSATRHVVQMCVCAFCIWGGGSVEHTQGVRICTSTDDCQLGTRHTTPLPVYRPAGFKSLLYRNEKGKF
jgi:hypothetical protein